MRLVRGVSWPTPLCVLRSPQRPPTTFAKSTNSRHCTPGCLPAAGATRLSWLSLSTGGTPTTSALRQSRTDDWRTESWRRAVRCTRGVGRCIF
eukprot:1253054-Prymnesium_polylepis.1